MAAKVLVELRDDLHVGQISEGEQVVHHAYRIANAQTVPGDQLHNGFVLGNPIRTRKHFAISQEEIAVVHESKPRQTKTSSCRSLERPARKQFVELIVDVRMTDDFAAGVGQEQSLHDPEFFVRVQLQRIRRLVRMPAQKFQQLFVAALAHRLTQLGHLLHGLG